VLSTKRFPWNEDFYFGSEIEVMASSLTTMSAVMSEECDGEGSFTRMATQFLFKRRRGDHVKENLLSLCIICLISSNESIDEAESIQD
jgi:hypothetical protein